MTIIQSVILGIIQGITEFLPISSSGHLAIFQYLFGINEGNLFFSLMLHFATLMSIIFVFYKDIKDIIIELFQFIVSLFGNHEKILKNNAKLGLLIILGNIPTFIIAFLFKDKFDSIYKYPVVISVFFLITGALLMISSKKSSETKDIADFKYTDALLIGLFQGIAILPGISRSGLTISISLLLGIKREVATKFSFLLSAPVIFGAFLFDMLDFGDASTKGSFDISVFIGMVCAFVVGIFSIKLLTKLLNNKKLYLFSYYLWILGSSIIIYILLRGVIIG